MLCMIQPVVQYCMTKTDSQVGSISGLMWRFDKLWYNGTRDSSVRSDRYQYTFLALGARTVSDCRGTQKQAESSQIELADLWLRFLLRGAWYNEKHR